MSGKLSNMGKWEIGLVAAAILLLAVWGLILYRPKQSDDDLIAVITTQSEETLRINLSQVDEPYEIAMEQKTGKPVHFQVESGRIRFIDVSCPDQICVNTGWCDAPGERAVCMPNKTALVLYEAGQSPP